MLDMLAWHEVVGQWARKEVYPTEKVDIIKPQAGSNRVQQGPTSPVHLWQGREGSSTNRRSIKELKDN
jgi:hypothetical protein